MTKTEEVQMTDEGRISIPKWADAVRDHSSYFDDSTDQQLVSLARATCKALEQPAVSFEQVLKLMENRGISKHDAGVFLIGAEASFCLDVANKGP